MRASAYYRSGLKKEFPTRKSGGLRPRLWQHCPSMDLSRQYATTANLAARIALHQRCSTNPHPFQRWVFDRLGLAAGMRVLEIACGTGSLWRENADRLPPVDLVLSDFSLSMVSGCRSVAGAHLVNC